MSQVTWESISGYVQRAFEAGGRVERADVIDLAYADGASDDAIDAIDAIGSRVFRTLADTRAFLVQAKAIKA